MMMMMLTLVSDVVVMMMIAQGLFSQTDCLDIILQNNRLSPNMSIMLQSRFVVRFIGF